MKTNLNLLQTRIFCAVALGIGSFFGLSAATKASADTAPATTAIPWSQLGAKAGADYQGDALAIIPTAEGTRLRCAFQRLEGEATREGLWLTSTVTNAVNDRFRIVAAELGRAAHFGVRRQSAAATPLSENERMLTGAVISKSGVALRFPPQSKTLPPTGNVSIDGQSVRFTRPGLVEEYTASMDGVRQDFVVLERPPGLGELVLRLAVSGARVESAASGAQVVLANSGRKIAYSRLKVTDANGRELPARTEVATAAESKIRNQKSEILRVVVNDAEAVYPVRIDPTFSDANWSSMGGIPGVAGVAIEVGPMISAAVVDDSGNLYIGGSFNVAGEVIANNIAKWDGSSWSALGTGLGGYSVVSALAMSGSDLYAGGLFTTAGGIAATNIAKWNGSSWTALGSGMGSETGGGVRALAVSRGDLYAGGYFTTAGSSQANNIAKWDGNSWSVLGSGLNGPVSALAVSGSDLYAGGYLTTAGDSPANNIAKWDGSTWTALGSGMSGGGDYQGVSALAVLGSDLYAGGKFLTAGGNPASNIAKWNGSHWSALGLGLNGRVLGLVVSGGEVYAGGWFTTAGGTSADYIAKWNGSAWSAMGSGMDNVGGITEVSALAVSGNDVYAGGYFIRAGGILARNIARWDGSSWSSLGSGVGGAPAARVLALAVSGRDLYAEGWFKTAGGSPANYIAKWDGSAWSALGSGMDGIVNALAVSGGNLYAGGSFTTAGGHAANSIAKWDGSTWSALGSGMNQDGYVNALAVSGTNLYAGGAKWDGNSWSALGSGLNGTVSALAVLGSDLYAGGDFTTAGGKVSAYIARAYLAVLPTLSVLRSGENLTVSWPTVDTAGFALEQAGPLAAPAGWVPNSATVTDDGANKSVTLPATNSSQFFRLRRP